jgi:nitrogen PTS system EIIA component
MEIKNALDEELICVLKSAAKKEAIIELINLIKNSGKIKNISDVQDSIFHREKLMSTGIGLGIAVPHTRVEGVENPVMAVGISPGGIKDYDSIDGEKVKIVVLVICGSRQHKEYISLLSAVVNKLKDKKRKEKLICAKDKKEACKILCG